MVHLPATAPHPERSPARSDPRVRAPRARLLPLVLTALVLAACGEAAGGTVTVTEEAPTTPEAAEAGHRLGWVVALADPLEHRDTAIECLDRGVHCPPDAALDTDTTRLQSASLAIALRDATDPAHPSHLGEPGPSRRELALQTVSAAQEVSEHLGGWIALGCPGTLDGVPIEDPPEECPALADQARAAIARLATALRSWGLEVGGQVGGQVG